VVLNLGCVGSGAIIYTDLSVPRLHSSISDDKKAIADVSRINIDSVDETRMLIPVLHSHTTFVYEATCGASLIGPTDKRLLYYLLQGADNGFQTTYEQCTRYSRAFMIHLGLDVTKL
jgi:hypothetical protein